MTFTIPETALAQHIAVLGKTGSGKTSTAKLAVEHVVKHEARVCILDPIKSDWWGLTSSASGERAGLPFHILGGPRGHVALHPSAGKAVGEIVASGELPLSIIDMALFNPGGQAQFFIDFAPTLIRRMRGVVYLVIEEAHLFAPKERSGIGAENMSIHWAKMLATAGRSKGIRLIVVTQRTQALHNALLGSCDTMIAHRLTAPADQEPVVKWLKANTDKATTEKVAASLSSLPTGSGWLCSGEAKVFELVRFPRINTYDNTATPTGKGSDHEVKTAPVDQERLRTIIGTAVKEAEANDPKALKAELSRANTELAKLRKSANTAPNSDVRIDSGAALKERERTVAAGKREAYTDGYTDGDRDGFARGASVALEQSYRAIREAMKAFVGVEFVPPKTRPRIYIAQAPVAQQTERQIPKPQAAGSITAGRATSSLDGLSRPQRKVMASIAFWRSVGTNQPTRSQVGGVAGYSPSSGGFNNLLGLLNRGGLITIPAPGLIALAPDATFEPLTAFEAREAVLAVISNPQRKLVLAVFDAADDITRDDLAAATDYSPTSGGFNNLIGALCTLTIFEKPGPGRVRLSDWAREVLSNG